MPRTSVVPKNFPWPLKFIKLRIKWLQTILKSKLAIFWRNSEVSFNNKTEDFGITQLSFQDETGDVGISKLALRIQRE